MGPLRLESPVRLFLAFLAAVVSCSSVGRAQDPAPAGPRAEGTDDRAEDRDAIRGVLRSFLDALQAGDAKALADHFTAEGEFLGVEGGPVRGREALEQAYAAMFEGGTRPEAEVTPGTLRFVAGDVAIEEGSVVVRRGEAEPPVSARYTALFVREDGRWRLARLEEAAVGGTEARDLDWLVGEWRSSGEEGAEVQTTYAWDRNKVFLHVDFMIKEGDRLLDGTQNPRHRPGDGRAEFVDFRGERGRRRGGLGPRRRSLGHRRGRVPGRRQHAGRHEHPHPSRRRHLHLAVGRPHARRRRVAGPPAGAGHARRGGAGRRVIEVGMIRGTDRDEGRIRRCEARSV